MANNTQGLDAALALIQREHLDEALQAAQTAPLPEGDKFSVLHKGKRYEPKALLASAYRFATGRAADGLLLDAALAYAPFNERLQALRCRVVPAGKRDEVLESSVLLYEVKKSPEVQGNFDRLFSSNRNCFYWNADKFSKLVSDEVVFIVNAAQKQLLFTRIERPNLPATYDEAADLTRFDDRGEHFEVRGQWKEFVRFRVLKQYSLPETWQWKTLGSGEYTYFGGIHAAVQSAANNLERLNLLLEVVEPRSDAEFVLTACHDLLKPLVPPVEAPEVLPAQAPQVWYVMQGKTFNEQQGKRYLWAPLTDKTGKPLGHHTAVSMVKPGDVVVHHADGVKGLSVAVSAPRQAPNPVPDPSWNVAGHLVEVQMVAELQPHITIDQLRALQPRLAAALQGLRGPFGADGTGKQGYLFEFNWPALAILLAQVQVSLPQDLAQWLPVVPDEAQTAATEEGLALPKQVSALAPKQWLQAVHQFMAQRGYQFGFDEVANFYLSLRTKPLVILAGISGTGKTQIVRQFAKALRYGDERHCVLIPVRPDWSDNTDLIGYQNLQGKFEAKALLKVLQDAMAHPDEPFFVILDEMNLARVEHYFSDFLSVLETRERSAEGLIRTQAVLNEPTVNQGVPVVIPQNLMFIGTVNMDETTHPFSRKVLDRANAIEMNEVNLDWPQPQAGEPQEVGGVFADAFVSPYLNAIHLNAAQQQALQPTIELLKQINQVLEPAGLHFGYRVRDEVAFYLALNAELQLLTEQQALDRQLMQKVLPRIQGSSMAVLRALLAMLQLLTQEPAITPEASYADVEAALKGKLEAQPYRLSVAKLLFMLRRFNDDGFTSFWL